MILTEQKPIEEIIDKLKDEKKIFILGCGGCPEGAETGGIKEINKMKEALEKEGKEITGTMSIDFLCQKALIRSRTRPRIDIIKNSNAVLVLSCGLGVQASTEVLSKICYPALNTKTFGGRITGMWQSTERCDTCGDCLLDYTGGICPYTACPKQLLNGACAGQSDGKCETDPDRDCGWELIYNRLKDIGQLDRLYKFIEPRNYNKMLTKEELRKSKLWALDEEVI
ncbi:MAG: methylenetetrahydrofolate reductase C-terminal domain-containing protein [Candidatus Humimicrobiaceae bacterium]